MKKTICVLLTVIFMFSICCIPMNAATANDNITEQDIITTMQSEKFQFLLQSFYTAPERLGFTKAQVQNAVFGEPFNFAELNDNGTVTNVESIKYIPIYYNNEMFAMVTLTKVKGKIYVTISEWYAQKIQDFIDNSSSERIAFIATDETIYAVDEQDNIATIFPEVPSSISTYSLDSIINISFSDADLSTNLLKTNVSNQTAQPVMPVTTRSIVNNGDDHYLYNYPALSQYEEGGYDSKGKNYACWATTILSMVRYEKVAAAATLTVPQIYRDANKVCPDAAKVSEALEVMKKYFQKPYAPTEVKVLPFSEIQRYVNNDDPIFVAFKILDPPPKTNEPAGHAMALVGYRGTSSGYNLWIMDPALKKTVLVYVEDDGTLYLPQSTTTYSWASSICFYYYVS